MAHFKSDEEFGRFMRQLTGDDAIYEEFMDETQASSRPETDPESVGGAQLLDLNDELEEEEEDEAPYKDGLPSPVCPGGPRPGKLMTEQEYMNQLRDEDWQSDDSTEMILNVRHLSMRARKTARDEEVQSNRLEQFLNKTDGPRSQGTGLDDGSGEDSLGLKKGEQVPDGFALTPWKALRKYPYSFVGRESRELCEHFFTAKGLCSYTTWDLYYLYHPTETARNPYLFVPTEQFQKYLDKINDELALKLAIPGGSNRDKFVLYFNEPITPRPRYLGDCSTYDAFTFLSEHIPSMLHEDNLQAVTGIAREDFLERLELIHQAGKNNTKKSDKNRAKRLESHRAWGQSFKRVQRYLGLRHCILLQGDDRPPDPPRPLHVDYPVPNDMEGSVVFVCFDVEAYEFNQNIITEVGIVTLDARDIEDVSPGPLGEHWHELIKARHLRISENSWANNSRHVKGCADRFNFGQSEFVPEASVAEILDEVLQAQGDDGETRSVVLVFHDAPSDVAYLASVGCDVSQYCNIIETVDTRNMHQYMTRALNPAKLETVMGYLNIPCWNLHNAGNDAMYTMIAMVALAVKKREESLSKYFSRDNKEEMPSLPVPVAEVVKHDEGWTSGGELTDGGLPEQQRGSW